MAEGERHQAVMDGGAGLTAFRFKTRTQMNKKDYINYICTVSFLSTQLDGSRTRVSAEITVTCRAPQRDGAEIHNRKGISNGKKIRI